MKLRPHLLKKPEYGKGVGEIITVDCADKKDA